MSSKSPLKFHKIRPLFHPKNELTFSPDCRKILTERKGVFTMLTIRYATTKDAKDLLEIYAPYVTNTAITFEYIIPSLEEFTDRMDGILKKYPYLVAILDGEICGYAYASPFKVRAAYAWSVETSIYVKEGCHGKGIGKALYEALEKDLRRQNVCNLCACIAYPNPESIAFHTYFGYETVAHFHKSGYKSGRWYDMIWMEKTLCEHEEPPKPFIPFPELN